MFPTCVGMNLQRLVELYSKSHVPHVCGDEPVEGEKRNFTQECSPRVWG